jgi:acyl dehydratase
MHESTKGAVLLERRIVVDDAAIAAVARAIGTPSAEATARLVPFFAPTLGGEHLVVDGIGLDLNRALLGGLHYEWVRPFAVGETLDVRLSVEDVFQRGSNQFGVLVAEFRDEDGELVQRQSTTFIERQDG